MSNHKNPSHNRTLLAVPTRSVLSGGVELLTPTAIPHISHTTRGCTDDSDPSARHISLLGTTEQRIVFSPVEIRNPALSSEASGSAAKGKTPGRESSSTPKKSKKKASLGTGGIEEVVGSLGGVDVLKPPALDEEDPDPHSGPSTRSKTTGKKDSVAQDDDDEDDDLYATDEDDVGETRNNGAVETGPRLQQMSLQTDMDDARHSMDQFIQSPTTTGISISMTSAVTVAERNAPQDRHQYGAPLANDGVLMAIDPALGGTAPPENDRTLEPRETCDK